MVSTRDISTLGEKLLLATAKNPNATEKILKSNDVVAIYALMKFTSNGVDKKMEFTHPARYKALIKSTDVYYERKFDQIRNLKIIRNQVKKLFPECIHYEIRDKVKKTIITKNHSLKQIKKKENER